MKKIFSVIIILFTFSQILSQQNFQVLSSIQTSFYEEGGFGGIVAGVDFDQDGRTELYICNSNNADRPNELIPRLYKFEWNGNSWVKVWSTVAPVNLIEYQNTWPALTYGDLDNDNRPELYWGPVNFFHTILNPARILVYEYPGDGSDNMGVSDGFGEFLPNASTTIVNAYNFNLRPVKFEIADIDDDGIRELIFVDRAGSIGDFHIGVLSVDDVPNNGSGLETWTIEFSGLGNPTLSGTGNKYDLAVLNNYIYIFDANYTGVNKVWPIKYSSGTWQSLPGLSGIVGGNSSFRGAQVVDLNNDGIKEIIVGEWLGAKVWLLQQSGDNLVSTQIADLASLGGTRLNGSGAGDLDADGKLDFVFGSRYDINNAVNNPVFRVEYQGGDIANPSNYIASMIDSLLLPLGGDLDVITVANVHGDTRSEVIYTQGYSRGSPNDYPGDVRILGINSSSSSISVSTPIGGENWQVGGTYDITWDYSNVSNVKIDYTTDDGTSWLPITASTPSDGSYSWTIPNTPSTQCKVRITDVDNPLISDESDGVFTISAPASPRIRMRIVANGLPEPEYIRLCVTNLVGIPVTNITKPVSGSFVEFDQADLQIISGLPGWKFDKVELRSSSSLIGHISFKYKREDFQNNKQVDALLYLHPYPTNLDNYPGWNYYSSNNERMVSMLIPPAESFDEINYSNQLNILVHGVNGYYPTWSTDLINGLSVQGNDTWQFYYPFDQEIESSGYLLREALKTLLQTGPLGSGVYLGRANIVAHSMGGLVTRAYIKSPEYTYDIQKLLMMGTPNNGSHSEYRINNESSGIVLAALRSIFSNLDPQAPAHKQMIPGSQFLMWLNSSPPRSLFPGAILNKTYFAIAGINKIPALQLFHTEILGQEDGVVAVSSASLLNWSIPLGVINLNHTQLTELISPITILDFLSPTFDPLISPTNLVGYWTDGNTQIISPPPSFRSNRGVLLLDIPGLNIKQMEVRFEEPDKLVLRENLLDLNPLEPYYMKRSGGSNISTYFSRTDWNDPSHNEIGIGLQQTSTILYTLEFQFPMRYWLRWGRAKIFPNSLPFKYLQSTMGLINLSSGILTILNSRSYIGPNLIMINDNHKKNQLFTLHKHGAQFLKNQLISEYLVDTSVDSITFLLNNSAGGSQFEFHNMKLITPTGQIIDSTTALSDPEFEFNQDINNGIVYYFVKQPQPGIWSVTYSDSLSEAIIYAPLATDFNINISFIDSLHSAGQMVNLEIPLPQPIDYTNVEISSNVFRSINGSDTLILVGTIPLTLSSDGLKYIGQFTPSLEGTYYVGINFSCNRTGEIITRNLLEPLIVTSIAPPQLLQPINNQNVTTDSVQFYWQSSLNTNSYRLQIITLTDSLPVLDQGGISDTTFTFVLPINQERFYWKVQAINGADSSNWSEFRSFTRQTIILSLTVNITDGWNMVSVPGVNPNGQGVDFWWSGRNPLADVYKWNGTYTPITSATPTEGYWMLHTGANTYNTGDEWPAGGIQIVAHDPIPITTGWNMIGGYENSALVSGLTTTPGNLIVAGTVYGWSGGYYNPTNLVPGYGYWLLSTGDGVINSPTLAKGTSKLVAQDNKEEWGKITITDAVGKSYVLYAVNGEVNLESYQLPPLPPTGTFDVRYSSNRKAEDLKERNQTIEMRGITYPVKVRVEKVGIRLQDETGKIVNERLKTGEEITISNSSVSKLMVSADLIPVEYALEQNYPNPFNNSTVIRYSLPHQGLVTVKAYSIIGEEVATLVNETKEAGKYQITFNAESLSSGVYFYRLQVGSFVETKKMILLK